MDDCWDAAADDEVVKDDGALGMMHANCSVCLEDAFCGQQQG